MPVSAMQVSFAGGEWSPSLYGRVDLAKYPTAVRQCKNFVVHPHGGVSNRGGTEFVCEVKDSTKTVRLLPFEFSVTQSYMLVFGDYTMRVLKDGAEVALPSTPTAWSSGTTYAPGDHARASSVNYYAIQASTNKAPATETSYWYALTDDIVEIPTPYAEADLPLLKFTQSYDVLYLCHPSHAPRKLSRTNHHVWTLSTIAYGSSLAAPTGLSRSSGSGVANNWTVTAVAADGEESLAPSSVQATAADSLSWSAVSGADHYNVYMDTGGGSFAFVTESRATTCKLPSTITYSKTAPLARAPFSGTNNYPGVAEFFEQRLWYGRTNTKPQTIWASQTGNYDNLNVSSPLRDDDGCEFTISARQVNEIRGLVSLGDMVIFTSGGEWRMTSGSNSDAVTPTSVDIKQQSKWGSSHLRPILVGNTVLFVGASGNVVRDFLYSLDVNGYAGNDLTLLANHLLRTRTVVDWAYQQYPDSVVWAVTNDGKLLGMTYAREHEVWAWHQHDTDGLFENVASIPASDGKVDVYFVVQREIDGVDKRYVERFRERLPDEDITQAWFLDCALQYNDVPADTISGLDHLEGVTVMALADGNVYSDLVVTNGEVTLPQNVSVATIGLPYEQRIETMEVEISGEGGTLQDRHRNVQSVMLRLENTRGLFVGPDDAGILEIPFRSIEDYGDPIALYTGDKEIDVQAGDGKSARIVIANSNPIPISILSLTLRVSYGDL
jgi:hypothetical protein